MQPSYNLNKNHRAAKCRFFFDKARYSILGFVLFSVAVPLSVNAGKPASCIRGLLPVKKSAAAEIFGAIHSRLGGEIRLIGHGDVDEIQWIPKHYGRPQGELLIESSKNGTHMVYVIETNEPFRGQGVNTMLLAKAVMDRPKLKTFEGTLMWVNRDVYYSARKRGLSKFDAVRQTPFYRSAKAVGFSKISPLSTIPDNPNAEVTLVVERD